MVPICQLHAMIPASTAAAVRVGSGVDQDSVISALWHCVTEVVEKVNRLEPETLRLRKQLLQLQKQMDKFEREMIEALADIHLAYAAAAAGCDSDAQTTDSDFDLNALD
eukprot:s3780_g3.t1